MESLVSPASRYPPAMTTSETMSRASAFRLARDLRTRYHAHTSVGQHTDGRWYVEAIIGDILGGVFHSRTEAEDAIAAWIRENVEYVADALEAEEANA